MKGGFIQFSVNMGSMDVGDGKDMNVPDSSEARQQQDMVCATFTYFEKNYSGLQNLRKKNCSTMNAKKIPGPR